ncbi:hypothetical protein BU17DRAFT_71205 [Hysterangium stoloniferum]|nr:hypothetical protein BU17DRAFT_71205 [Hysterangium stoloniferum]
MPNIQLVLSHSNRSGAKECIWSNTFMFPAYLAVGLLVVQTFITIISRVWRDKASRHVPASPSSGTFLNETKQWFKALGTTSITLRILRFLATLTLTGFTAIAFISLQNKKSKLHSFDDGFMHRDVSVNSPIFTQAEWIEVVYLLLYSYISVLALLDILPRRRWYSAATVHLNFVMFAIVSVYTYRDLFPYATFTLRPADEGQGWLLWSRLGLATFAGLFVPLVIPRIYTPVDPLNPSKHLNTEQTTSWLSYVTYSYMDPLIIKGVRTTLTYEDLPPLADYDASAYLVARSAPALDPYIHGTKRHIFWGLMSLLSSDYLALTTLTVLQCLIGFLSPVALNQLLHYLEDGQDAFIRPWFWALCLFIGPIIRSLASSFYYFIGTRVLVHAEAIITQDPYERGDYGNYFDGNYADSNYADSNYADSNYADSNYADSNYADSNYADSNYADSNYADSNYADSNYADSNYADSNYADSNYADSNYADSNYADSNYADSNYADSNYADSNYADSNYADSNYADSNYADSNYADSNYADSNYADSNYSDSNYSG